MKQTLAALFVLATLVLLLLPARPANTYPLPGGVEHTGIRRLIRLDRIDSAKLVKTLPYGARYAVPYVRLNLMDRAIDSNLLVRDTTLEEELEELIPNRGRAYSLAIMDVTNGQEPRYLERNATLGYQPGSVGKLAVITALMCELENVYVDSIGKRWELLRNKIVQGGPFAVYDHHTIPEYDPESERYSRPRVNEQHAFSLYEWADHMLSVSNNGAASVVWREAILMRVFGLRYPALTAEEASDYFKNTPRRELSDIANSVVNEPLRHLGIGHDEWRLGTMFTRGASAIVPPQGGCIGTPRGIMTWMTALESGKVIDPPSSLEIKRLMYMTDRRIRYARAPALDSAAVYFKSGSLYGCIPGTSCGKYKGNRMNYMNSVAIVEQAGGTRYLVALMTNVLSRNSAYDHQLLATRIDQLLRKTAKNHSSNPNDNISKGEK
ncbi:MAG: serine hydrolase [Bacteroidota bacterium]